MKKIAIVLVLVLGLAGGTQAIYLNSDYYYSKKLVSAIEDEDIIKVQQIIERKPTCINRYPAITSQWWHSAMNWRVYYPLNEACATGNIDLIELLLENGADINCNDGFTPLSTIYHAKTDNWYNISLMLIEEGASLNYTTEYTGDSIAVLEDIVHRPPLAPDLDDEEVRKAFVYALENCDQSKIDWGRVMQQTICHDRIEIMQLLLDEGYWGVNDDWYGMTALMFAARDSTPEMVQFLLDYGADKSVKSSDGETAYDIAIRYERTAVIPVLGGAQ